MFAGVTSVGIYTGSSMCVDNSLSETKKSLPEMLDLFVELY